VVLDKRADIGLALDGDADRLVVVDEKGETVDGDKLMAVLAVHLKSTGGLKGDGMVATVMSNQGLEEYLAEHGITLYRSAVGDKNVVAMMQEKGVNFGGEQSGHIIFSDYAKTGDGISSALQALAYLSSSKQKASEAFNPYDAYPQMLLNLPISKKPALESIPGIEGLMAEVEASGMRHLFRYSGTENLIRILLEGKDAAKLETMMRTCEDFFRNELL